MLAPRHVAEKGPARLAPERLGVADAAEAFGKGRDVPDFRPSGATEVRRAALAFLDMRERISRFVQQRTDMLAGVSHDLRLDARRVVVVLRIGRGGLHGRGVGARRRRGARRYAGRDANLRRLSGGHHAFRASHRSALADAGAPCFNIIFHSSELLPGGSPYNVTKEDVERFYRSYYLRPKPILRIIKTMLEDKDVCVRRLREGYEFFKSMAQRRSDLAMARATA